MEKGEISSSGGRAAALETAEHRQQAAAGCDRFRAGPCIPAIERFNGLDFGFDLSHLLPRDTRWLDYAHARMLGRLRCDQLG